MLNVYNVYAISPSKYPAVKLEGALAFMDFLTSEIVPERARALPLGAAARASSRRPSPGVTSRAARRAPSRRAGSSRSWGRSRRPCPAPIRWPAARSGSRALATPLNPIVLDRDRRAPAGAFRLRARLTRSGTLFLTTPRFENLSPLSQSLGPVQVRASVSLRRRARVRRVGSRCAGGSSRRTAGAAAVLQIRARQRRHAGSASCAASGCPNGEPLSGRCQPSRRLMGAEHPLRRPGHRRARRLARSLGLCAVIAAASAAAPRGGRRGRGPRAAAGRRAPPRPRRRSARRSTGPRAATCCAPRGRPRSPWPTRPRCRCGGS